MSKRKQRANGYSLSKQRLRLWIRILRTARAIEAEVRERLRTQFGVTLPQFDVMAALDRKPEGMTMSELSRFLMVSNGNVTGIIDRLVDSKLVTRKAPEEDRRAIIVRLTPQGASRFATMAEAHESWVNRLLSEFNETNTASVIGHLDGLSKRIHSGEMRA